VAEPASHHRADTTPRRLALIWLPGLAVACGAAVATAHGLYEVALAARVPAAIAWLYPLITDGLALVAYAATARLTGSAARYAWAVGVIAAGLSGLAQASLLATDELAAAPILRFGVGAWPAIAAAVVAHLLYLLMDAPQQTDRAHIALSAATTAIRPSPPAPMSTPASRPSSRPPSNELSECDPDAQSTCPTRPVSPAVSSPTPSVPAAAVRRAPRGRSSGPPGAMRARASAAANTYLAEQGSLPTVRTLMAAAEVSRGTAAVALHDLRQRAAALHLVAPTENEPPKERGQ
jgi:hypothetical protein